MRILLTGGRAPVCLDLARRFARDGHTVFIAESQRIHLSRSSRAVRRNFHVPSPRHRTRNFLDAMVRLVEEQQIDVLLPTCEEIFFLARARERFPKTCRLWFESTDRLRTLHDKGRFAALAREFGMTSPESYVVDSVAALAAHAHRGGSWILKPAFSRFGRSILRGRVSEFVAQTPDFENGRQWILQRFVEGFECCAYAVADGGAVKAISVYGHEFVAGRAGISFEEVALPRVRRQVLEFAERLRFTGQFAFDFIVDRDGVPFVLECNPRATSGVHLLATESGFTEAFTRPEVIANPVQVRAGRRAMLGLPVALLGLFQIRSPRKFGAWITTLLRSREAIFSFRDPLPFFDQMVCTVALVITGWRSRLDPLAASTVDIEWNGTP